ncbi:Hypothetical predicted protein, partial [Cloeon dipterum]
CKDVYKEFKKGNRIKIYGGACETQDDLSTCHKLQYFDKGRGSGLLSQKVLDGQPLNLVGLPYLHLWNVENLNLSDSLKPVCLWNEGNSRDGELQFKKGDSYGFVENLSGYTNTEKCFSIECSGSKRHDLALVLVGENPINVTDSVRPICLWNDDYDFEKIANSNGKVVGRALTDGQNARYLQKIDLRVAPYVECFASNRAFFAEYMYPTENFCATDNGLSIKEGGTGLVFYNSTLRRYFLRGVLIERITSSNRSTGSYSLFTDTTNYMTWIAQNSRLD